MQRDAETRGATAVDGRRQRRERGRLHVVDTMIDVLLEEGEPVTGGPATAEQIALRAGVSPASLFRYFANVDELRHHAIQRYLERYGHLMEIPELGEASRERRIETLVAARIRYHETVAPVARIVRRRARDAAEIRDTLGRIRSAMADQFRHHFAPELASLRPAARRELVAVLAALTSFESWDQLDEQGLDRRQIKRALSSSVDRLLPPTP
jgi:AcrR family transcriptional regulator